MSGTEKRASKRSDSGPLALGLSVTARGMPGCGLVSPHKRRTEQLGAGPGRQGEEVRQVWEVSWVGVGARLVTANVSPCKAG